MAQAGVSHSLRRCWPCHFSLPVPRGALLLLHSPSLSHLWTWTSLAWTWCSSCLAGPPWSPEAPHPDSCPLLLMAKDAEAALWAGEVLLALYRTEFKLLVFVIKGVTLSEPAIVFWAHDRDCLTSRAHLLLSEAGVVRGTGARPQETGV